MNGNEHEYECQDNDNLVQIDTDEIRVAKCTRKEWLIVGFSDLIAAFAAAGYRCSIEPQTERDEGAVGKAVDALRTHIKSGTKGTYQCPADAAWVVEFTHDMEKVHLSAWMRLDAVDIIATSTTPSTFEIAEEDGIPYGSTPSDVDEFEPLHPSLVDSADDSAAPSTHFVQVGEPKPQGESITVSSHAAPSDRYVESSLLGEIARLRSTLQLVLEKIPYSELDGWGVIIPIIEALSPESKDGE